MLKIYFFIFAFFYSINLFSQTTIAIQNFDEINPEWDFTNNIPFFDNNADGFFGIHDGDNDSDPNDTGIATGVNALNLLHLENDFLFINDLNDEGDNGTNDEAILAFSTFNISTYTNVFLSFDYEIVGFDSADYIQYEIIEDGLSTVIINLPKNDSGTISMPIQNKTKFVSINLIIKQNGADDYAGIDNIKLQGEEIIPCSELMISEYVEGTSSTNHRNNFIEIYNPSNITVDLDNYALVKYTGSNLNTSGTIYLTGAITAYGTYLIEDAKENIGTEADLSSGSSVMDYTGDDKIALINSGVIIDILGVIGEIENFAKDITLRRKSDIQSPNNQFDSNEWESYALEDVTNLNSHVSTCSGIIPEIQIYGNSNEITDGSTISNTVNNTLFGGVATTSDMTVTNSFIIKNIGSDILEINNIVIIGIHASHFSLENNISIHINPKDSIAFQINFNPTSKGIKTATVQITNNDASENPFDFIIQGEGTGISNSPLMITQYYEGEGNNKWIEITNISELSTPDNTYYLALYWNEDAKSPIGNTPSRKKLIPPLNPGQTIKYRASLNVTSPEYALDGNEIKTSVCGFTGDDIILISTTDDKTCWANKIDIIGNSNDWGTNISMVRKYGCENVQAKTGFEITDWFVFEISEINSAMTGLNLRIGEYYSGTTIFDNNSTWNNGLPDKYREAFIDIDFDTSIHGNIEVCSLTINKNITMNINIDNYVSIINDLNVIGILNVSSDGSLLMINNSGSVINNGTTNIYRTTTTLKKHDYTYWSAPVKNAMLEEVFVDSPQNSFYKFEPQNYSDSDQDGYDDDENAWQRAIGNMEVGKGYTAMAPNTNPFMDTQSVVFSGEVNNGSITVPVNLSNDISNENDDWNLIGNPYPSAIDAELFMHNETNQSILNGSLYFWTHNTSVTADDNQKYSSDDYAMYTIGTGGIMANSQGQIPTQFIASGQGFFVEAIQSGNIEFNNEMRVQSNNNNFFKNFNTKDSKNPFSTKLIKEQKNKIWLNLYNDQGAFSQILIGFLESASSSYESVFDGLRLDANNYLSFFSVVDNHHLAIQGTDPFHGNETIPLGFNSKIDEVVTLKIGIDHVEGIFEERDIYLYDTELDLSHNLKKGDYEFTSTFKGLTTDRFYLKFNDVVIFEESDFVNEKLIVIPKDEFMLIRTTNNSIISSLIIYDLLGRRIIQLEPNKAKVLIKKNTFSSNGIFIMHTKLQDSRTLVKRFIK